MGSGVHFSLDSLPERYRKQALSQLGLCSASPVFGSAASGEVGGKSGKGESERERGSSAGAVLCNNNITNHSACAHPRARAKGKKVRSPISIGRRSEMSNPERKFNEDFLSGLGKYEAITLNLPGGTKYTADWFVRDPDDPAQLVLVEVKGNYKLQSHQRAATAFKIATATFPEFLFVWAEQQKNPAVWKIAAFMAGERVGEVFEGTSKDFILSNEIFLNSDKQSQGEEGRP